MPEYWALETHELMMEAMMSEDDEHPRLGMIEWLSTLLAVGAFFTYILVIGFSPQTFVRPVYEGSVLSIGLASGIVLTMFLVILVVIYTYVRNRESKQ